MLTTEQKTEITDLIRAILRADIPERIKRRMLDRFGYWRYPEPLDPSDGWEEVDYFRIKEIIETETILWQI